MSISLQEARGWDVQSTVERLRRYALVERRSIEILAGWFLKAPAYETKYRLADHLWDSAEHVHAIRERLSEMRGGQAEAWVEPRIKAVMDEALHAPDADSLLRGLYGVIKRDLAGALRLHLDRLDPAANAFEDRMLRRMLPEIDAQLAWYDSLGIDDPREPWQGYIAGLLRSAGGVGGDKPDETAPSVTRPSTPRFERPRSIVFDSRIARGELTAYEARQQADPRTAVVEQFKVFFNEFYAAALLASVIFDTFDDPLPWDFYHDFCHHFWDEARHSRFGAVRLKELGVEPSVCNQILFEQSEGLPPIHRICYLTLGLEVHFMPRKKPRVREYEQIGDSRSQLFADHDWSDEGMHVRYGKRWLDKLLEDDYRTTEDIQAEVREHIERITGRDQESIATPF